MMTCSIPAATASSTAYWKAADDEGQHLLGLGFRGGQEAGATPGGGEDGLADAHRTSAVREFGWGREPRGDCIPV